MYILSIAIIAALNGLQESPAARFCARFHPCGIANRLLFSSPHEFTLVNSLIRVKVSENLTRSTESNPSTSGMRAQGYSVTIAEKKVNLRCRWLGLP